MTTDEMDLLLGRLTRESKESRQQLAGLIAKLSAHSESLQGVSIALNGVWNPQPHPVTTVDDAIQAVRRLPEKEAMIATLKELQAERERCERLKTQLDAMGS